jgi:quinoprotein glucose dehydrogenase
VTAVIGYLASMSPAAGRFGGGNRGRGAGPAAVFPPGPVVETGGAPHPDLPPRSMGPFYPGAGGNAGNNPYPTDVTEVPSIRYMSDYGVLASFTKPPYTTLTAYDLNTGEIKWQVPNGDHPPTVRAGGPPNTGGVGARYGIVATKGGLVFHAGGDGKVRAYDEDTGQVLWTGSFVGGTSGVPVSYESKGRQYFVLLTSATGGRGGGGGAAGRGGAAPPPPLDPNAPTGAIAFALPKK